MSTIPKTEGTLVAITAADARRKTNLTNDLSSAKRVAAALPVIYRRIEEAANKGGACEKIGYEDLRIVDDDLKVITKKLSDLGYTVAIDNGDPEDTETYLVIQW